MMSPAVGAGTLERLSRLDTGGERVLSVFLDLEPARFPTPDARGAQLRALLAQARRDGGDAEAERVAELMRDDPELLRGAPGLAIFCSPQAGILEAVRLPSAVEPLAVLDAAPWLEPLVELVAAESASWGVAVVSRRGARLLRGGPSSLVEFATIRDDVHGRHAQGGWSQSRYQRGIEQEVAVHVRGVAERLLRAHRRRPFAHLAIVAAPELRPLVQDSLHADLAAVLAGVVDADLEHALVEEIAAAIAPVVEQADRDRERDLLARVEEGIGTGGRAAAGLDEVLAMLGEERVATLLIAPGTALPAEAVERAIELATRQSAEVELVRHEAGALARHGSIAALLHW